MRVGDWCLGFGNGFWEARGRPWRSRVPKDLVVNAEYERGFRDGIGAGTAAEHAVGAARYERQLDAAFDGTSM